MNRLLIGVGVAVVTATAQVHAGNESEVIEIEPKSGVLKSEFVVGSPDVEPYSYFLLGEP